MVHISLALVSASFSAEKPNVVFILADDLGYNEMNWMNATRGIQTPHLDALAHSGVTMKNYYVGAICSPTRSMLMTGRYTTRLGTQSSVIFWDTPWGVPINETFVGQDFQNAGYSTAMFGKWHLGMFKQAYTPKHRGFDEHAGYYQGCGSAWTHVAACCTAGSSYNDTDFVCKAGEGPTGKKADFRGYDWFATGANPTPESDSMPVLAANHTNSVDLIAGKAVEFIERKTKEAKAPFFMYLPFQNIHGPYTTQEKFFNLYSDRTKFTEGEATMFGYITELDDAVGTIVAALKSSGAYANTIVAFSSDNGAPSASADVNHLRPHVGGGMGDIARNYPLRGKKTYIWEGGVKVPGFISGGSALIPASARGTINEKLFHVTDWIPTLLGLAGVDVSLSHGRGAGEQFALDGFDVFGALTDPATPSPRKEMLYNVSPLCHSGQAQSPKAGLRIGDFKLLAWCFTVAGINGSTVTGPAMAPSSRSVDPGFYTNDGLVLYDLKADPTESTNIRADPAHAATVKQLLARMKAVALEMVEPQQWDPPYQGPEYFCADCPKHEATGAPDNGPATPWEPWL